MALELGAGLAVLVVQVEQEHLHGHAGPLGRADAAHRPLHDLGVVRRGVLRGRGRVPRGGPPGLGHGDRHGTEPLFLQRGHQRVHGGVEQVGVHQRAVLHGRGAGAEERVRELHVGRVVDVADERVGVHHEGRAGVGEELQHGAEDGEGGRVERSCGGRVRGGEHRGGVRGGDLHPASEPQRGERGVQVPHGRHEVRRVELVVVQHLVADGEVPDAVGGGVRQDRGPQPLRRALGPRRGQEGEVLVGHAHHEVDPRRGEGREHGRVGEEEPRLGDPVLLEQRRGGRRRWEVAADASVADADLARITCRCRRRHHRRDGEEDVAQKTQRCSRGHW